MSDVFFQPLDEARMKACVQAVAHEGFSVVVQCPQLTLLSYYGDVFLKHLREDLESGTIETYNPSDADALIENFNQIVSEMSMQEALQPGDLSAVKKVWVVKNAHVMQPHEVTLLAQLTQQFPGAKVRVILWMASSELNAGMLSAFGKKLMHWNIPLPTIVQTKTFSNLARAAGKEKELQPMLDQLKLIEHVPAALKTVKKSKSLSALGGITNKQENGLPSIIRKAIWCLLLLALLMGSAALVAWLNPDKLTWLQVEKPLPALTNENQALKAETLGIELPEAASEGLLWAEKLSGQGWLVLHGPFSGFAVAEQVKKAYPGLKNSQVVPVYKLNEPLASFVLATGPFEGLQEAEEFNKLSTLPNTGSVRTSRNLKSRLNPTVSP